VEIVRVILGKKHEGRKDSFEDYTRSEKRNFTYDVVAKAFIKHYVLLAAKKSDLALFKLMVCFFNERCKPLALYTLYTYPILQEIFANDADALLQEVITDSIQNNSVDAWISGIIPKLATFTLLPEFLTRCATKNTNKTFETTLKLFDSKFSVILENVGSEITPEVSNKHKNGRFDTTNWYSFIEALLYCKKKYPEFLPFDWNKFQTKPLDIAARVINRDLFDLFLKNGAAPDPAGSYIASAYLQEKLAARKFVKYLIAKGFDINVPLEAFGRKHSLLGFINDVLTEQRTVLIEDLLMNGAKLLPTEEEYYRKEDPTSERHRIANCQALPRYSLQLAEPILNGYKFTIALKALGTNPSFQSYDGQRVFTFVGGDVKIIRFGRDGERDTTITSWSLDKDGALDLKVHEFRFRMVKTYDGKTALLRVDAISKEGEIDLTQLFCPVE
jgi:hypothetical protein